MLQFGGGDKKAFDELYSRYFAKLLSFSMHSFGLDKQRAEDVVHDVFVKVIGQRQNYKPKARFSVWIFTICTNECKNRYNKNTLESKIFASNEPGEIIENQADVDITRSARSIIIKLDQKQKQVFLLKYVFGLSINEVAQILDLSEGTVKSRLFYGMKFLREGIFTNKFEIENHG